MKSRLGSLRLTVRSLRHVHTPGKCTGAGEQAADGHAAAGLLVLELGHDSLAAVQPLLEPPLWTSVGITNDLAGIPRVIAAERISVVQANSGA